MISSYVSSVSSGSVQTPDTVDQIFRTVQHLDGSVNTIIFLMVMIFGFTVGFLLVYLLYKIFDWFTNV